MKKDPLLKLAGVATLLLLLHQPELRAQIRTPLPPVAHRVDQVDVYHGVSVKDPFRWLEDMESESSLRWITAQDSLARNAIEPLAQRQSILEFLRGTQPGSRSSTPHVRSNGYFHQLSFRDGDEQVVQIVHRSREDSPTRVLVDLRDFDGAERFAALVGSGSPSFQVSPNGRYLAFGLSIDRQRWTRWHVYDVERDRLLADEIFGINTSMYTTVWWSRSSEGFYYSSTTPPENGDVAGAPDLSNQKVRFHRVGTDQDSDTVVFESPENPDWRYWVTSSGESDEQIVVESSNGADRSAFVLDPWGDADPVELYRDESLRIGVLDFVDGRVLALTHRGAPKGRIVSIDPTAASPADWDEVIPEDSDATLFAAWYLGDKIVAQYTRDALPEVVVYSSDGGYRRELELPYIGWLRSGFSGDRDQTVASFDIQGTADPGSVYTVDLTSGETSQFHSSAEGYDPSKYVTEQVFYPSKDGTMVPMFLMYLKGLEKNGDNPVWLFAYGSNWSAAPWYQTQHRAWLDMGGVYALANVRGGGEYGQAWIDAGSRVNKQVGIDDYIAAAEYLVDAGFSSNEKLVANGGSASGPIAGAAIVQRPYLFGAGLISYPVLDMLRYEALSNRLSANFGSVQNEEEFRALLQWSPYHNIADGQCYPPTLISHGDQDVLAPTAHSYKFLAAMQSAQGCENPILLQVAWGRGHTVGGLEERANQLAFLAELFEMSSPE